MVDTRFLAGGSRASIFATILALTTSLTAAFPAQNDYGAIDVFRRQGASNALGDCLSAAGIETSLPSSASWAADTEAWNSRLAPVPAAVVFPKTEKQVSAALKCASSTGTKVTTLGGNRSFSSMGFGRNDGALVINLKHMKVLKCDPRTNLVTYGGPVMISEAAGHVWGNCSRAMPHGRCPDVGMAGVSASGFGTLSRASGTVLDNVVGVRVALANGTILDADAKKNSDIYWAVRGAASSIGVVLKFHLKTLAPPSQTVFNYTIKFDPNHTVTQQDNVDALVGMQNWALSDDDNNDLLSARFALRTSSTIMGFFYGTKEEYDKVTSSLLRYLPSTMVLTTTQSNFWDSEEFTTPGLRAKSLTPRRYFYISSVTVSGSTPLDNSTAWQLFSSTVYEQKLPDASASGFVDLWGGSYNKGVRAEDSAWKHDDELLLVRWDIRSSSFDVPFAQSTLDAVHERFYAFVNAYKAAGGVPGGFTTYRDEKWDITETAEFLYGENWPRLQKIKTAVDPGEMFNTDPQSVPALT
ncbi:hypothetical protein DHEL01_v207711 [Diaporthe helianthi]|uniref:FAD-binding PCMH-type domain-containing protein n=1 Tax=Diaporthe helianthi TaxID=158607 RepID=A0A2P5HUF5_DIAHE|nr:hypothetical protein DHEL01_v207711 [Diaporthe helianthi]